MATGSFSQARDRKLLFKDPVLAGEITRDGERFLLAPRAGSSIQDPVTLITNWTSLLR